MKPGDRVLYHYNDSMGMYPVLLSVAATVREVDGDTLLLSYVRGPTTGKTITVRAPKADAPASGKWTKVLYVAPPPSKMVVPTLTMAELIQVGKETAVAFATKHGTVTSRDVLRAMQDDGVDFDEKKTPWLNLVFADRIWSKVDVKTIDKRKVSVWALA